MIEFLSSWAKGLGVTIVIVSIFEMLLPNNKTKKYIRMVLGVYVIFNIVSPFIQNKEVFSFDNIEWEKYKTVETSQEVNQTSMNDRIKELYEEELEKDIVKKIEEKGYEVTKCKVSTQIADEEEKTKIKKIELNLEEKRQQEVNEEENDTTENKIVTEIQKIKEVNTRVKIDNEEEKNDDSSQSSKKITQTDIQNVKKFLIEEYGMEEKCLKIN